VPHAKTCHGCAWEWADACDKNKLHLPSDNHFCQDCMRNPKCGQGRLRDHFIKPEQIIDELAEAKLAISQDLSR